jgi:hypothetical protein
LRRSRSAWGGRAGALVAIALSATWAIAAGSVVPDAPAAAKASAPQPPARDPFYRAPRGFASAAPGTIFRTRRVTVKLGSVPLTGSKYVAYQLLYRTNDAGRRPVANVATVIVPTGPRPKGGRTLVSLQDAEDSLDSTCAPSYQLQIGESDNHNLGAEMSIASPVLAQGRDVVIPDADGPRSEYIVTGIEGHSTLDSIRALERFGPAQLNGSDTKIGLVGYSGGAHESAAANELQPAYAPGLKIVGAAAGGVPVGNEQNARYLDGSVGASLLVGLAVSLNRAFPKLRAWSLLNANGKALAHKVSKGCATSVFAAPFAHMNEWTTVPNALQLPRVRRIIARNSLGHATPTAPTFYYNAVHDELVWIKPLDALVRRYCSGGARIDYYRDALAQEHIEALHDFIPLALAYLENRFAGKPAPTTCRR